MGFLSYCSSLSTNQPSTNSQHQHHSLQGVAFSMFLALYLQYGIVLGGKKKGWPSSRGRTAANKCTSTYNRCPIRAIRTVGQRRVRLPPGLPQPQKRPRFQVSTLPRLVRAYCTSDTFPRNQTKDKIERTILFRFDSLFLFFPFVSITLGRRAWSQSHNRRSSSSVTQGVRRRAGRYISSCV